jgi:hypothetical protein
VSLETWNVTQSDLLAGGEKKGGAGWWKRGTSQRRTHFLEGRKREERVSKFGNSARHKRGLTDWRGGRGRRGLVSLETRHITNKDSRAEREEEGGAGC